MNTRKSVKPSKGSKVLLATALIFIALGYLLRFLPMNMLVNMALGQCVILAGALIGIRCCGYDSESVLKIRPVDGRNLLLVVFTVICCYPITALLNLIYMQFVPNVVQTASAEIYTFGLGISLVLIALFPALGEELLMRGIVYRSYKEASPVAAMVLSALLFGLLHMNFNQMPYAMFLGIVMVLINEAADSMVMSMVMHFLFNASSTVLNYMSIQMSSQEARAEAAESVSHADWGLFMVFGIAALIMGLLLIVVIRAMYKYNHRTFDMAFGKGCEVVESEGKKSVSAEGCHRRMRIVDVWFVLTLIVLIFAMIRSII